MFRIITENGETVTGLDWDDLCSNYLERTDRVRVYYILPLVSKFFEVLVFDGLPA